MNTLLRACIVSVIACSGTAHADATYDVVHIGTLGSSTWGWDINDAGQATGYSSAPTGDHAFLYSGGAITDIGTLGGTNNVGYSFSAGIAINNDGVIVGNSRAMNGQTHAMAWQSGTMTDLGTMGGTQSTSTAIANNGTIVGQSSTNSGVYRSFITTDGSTLTDIGSLGGGAPAWGNNYATYAQGINESGQITGYSQASNYQRHAFIYDSGSWTDLGTLGGNESFGLKINESGQVAGYSALAQSGRFHAFVYRDGAMIDLGTLGGVSSWAYGINDAGVAVGESRNAQNATRAFIYANGVMTDLNDLIDPTSGWVLEQARSINSSGQIVGTGQYLGRTRAFVLDPFAIPGAVPEPASWAMMIAGFGLIGGLARRRRRIGYDDMQLTRRPVRSL